MAPRPSVGGRSDLCLATRAGLRPDPVADPFLLPPLGLHPHVGIPGEPCAWESGDVGFIPASVTDRLSLTLGGICPFVDLTRFGYEVEVVFTASMTSLRSGTGLFSVKDVVCPGTEQ